MTQDEAIQKIEDACKVISLEMMKVTPTARHLGDECHVLAVFKDGVRQ